MEHLKQLMAAGYQHGYTNGHGADDTVSGLEWALSHLDVSPGTTETYSRLAASNLESRLFTAYVLRCLAFIKLQQPDRALIEYRKAEGLVELLRQSHDSIQSVSESDIEETMAVAERRLREAGALS